MIADGVRKLREVSNWSINEQVAYRDLGIDPLLTHLGMKHSNGVYGMPEDWAKFRGPTRGEPRSPHWVKSASSLVRRFKLRQALNLNYEFPEYWFENEYGDRIIPDPETLEMSRPLPKEYIYQHSQSPRTVPHHVLELIRQEDVDACPHSEIVKDHGLIDGLEGRICRDCGGTQVKSIGEEWPAKWSGQGSRSVGSMNQTYPEDLVLAMTRPSREEWDTALSRGHLIEPVTLTRAIILAANSCERCLNVLCYRHGLKDGYEEFSEDWAKSNTRCKLCE